MEKEQKKEISLLKTIQDPYTLNLYAKALMEVIEEKIKNEKLDY